MLYTPFESFYIFFYIHSSYFTFSNLSFFIIITVAIIYTLFYITTFASHFINFDQFKYFTSELYSLTYNIINEQLPKEGKRYMPLMNYLFILIICFNLFGFFPYSVALTSQICLIFVVSFTMFFAMQYIAIELFKAQAFKFFLPPDIPSGLSIFIINVELISYIFRVVSLSVRILANIIAGHLLCTIIGIFVLSIYSDNGNILFLASLIPGVVIVALCFLELFVCILQAYVFIILCCMYLRDVLTIYLH